VEQRDLDRTLTTFGALREFELALARMYAVGGEQWPQDPAFWQALVSAEEGHARWIRTLAAIVAERSHCFIPGRPLTPIAVELQIDYVQHRTREFATGRMAERQALLVMRDLEASILEERFYELVSGDDPEFVGHIAAIVTDTRSHVGKLEQRMRASDEGARA
jgi:hypothetical protein